MSMNKKASLKKKILEMYGTVKMNNNICLKGNIYAVYDVF